MMTLAPLTYEPVLYVAENMREWDKREIYATRWDDDPASLARDAMVVPDFAWLASHGGEPVAAFGAIPLHPGVWSVWLFGTDNFSKIGFSLTKTLKRSMLPALVEHGVHRLECLSMEGHVVAQRWLEGFGAKPERLVPEYGRNRENFISYAWRRP